ncbi:MAG: hypothetical protein IGQ88_06070 [Gloeomargaritaceae cyanobacterium C42_A2020_066]|nr:hypothetical protein [Gloeomargaritaceae cyanobacterium C42_A2020_066]
MINQPRFVLAGLASLSLAFGNLAPTLAQHTGSVLNGLQNSKQAKPDPAAELGPINSPSPAEVQGLEGLPSTPTPAQVDLQVDQQPSLNIEGQPAPAFQWMPDVDWFQPGTGPGTGSGPASD